MLPPACLVAHWSMVRGPLLACENQNKPFFIFISLLEPHHQNHLDNYPAPHGYEERYRNSWIPLDLQALGGSTYMHLPGYYGMIKRIDEAYGRLIDALASLNLFESTNVIFTSDHGNQFKTRSSATAPIEGSAISRIRIMVCVGLLLTNQAAILPAKEVWCRSSSMGSTDGESVAYMTKGIFCNEDWPQYLFGETYARLDRLPVSPRSSLAELFE